MRLIDTKQIADRMKVEFTNEIATFNEQLRFTIISVGDNSANEKYMRNKMKHCEDVGIVTKHISLDSCITEPQLINRLLVEQQECDGIILQLPVVCDNPINIDNVIKYIDIVKDVDGLNYQSKGLLHTQNNLLCPATPNAVLSFLDEIEYDVTGKDVLVIGRSNLVGRPLAELLLQKDATVTVAHSRSNKEVFNRHYDVIVSCVGKPLHFKVDGDILIDVGINFLDGRMVGDFDIDNCKCEIATIPPNKYNGLKGGVGTLTCMELIRNIIKSYKLQNNINK